MHGWWRSSDAGASGPIGPSRAACSAAAFSAPVTMSRTSRAASSVRSPTVSASRGTRSSPPKSAAAAAIVDGCSATRCVPSPGRAPGSLNATCASRPRPRTARSTGAVSSSAWYRATSASGSAAAPSSASRRPNRDAFELAIEGDAEAARVVGPEPEVLVEAEHRRVLAGQRAIGRVCAQRGVEAARGVARGQQQPHARPRANAVGDQLGRGQPDVVGVVEDEQRWCH